MRKQEQNQTYCIWCDKTLIENLLTSKYGQFCNSDCYWDYYYHYDGDANHYDGDNDSSFLCDERISNE